MGVLDCCVPIVPGLLKHGYPLEAYPSGVVGSLRAASFLVYVISLLTFVVTAYIYNPINVFGDTLLESPSTTVIQQSFGPGCSALSVPTASQFGDFMPFPSLRVQATLFNPSGNPGFFLNGTSIDGAILSAGDVTISIGTVVNNTVATEFNLIVQLTPGIIELTGETQQCISLFTEQVDEWFATCGQTPLNDSSSCVASAPLGEISMSHSVPISYALQAQAPNATGIAEDVAAYFCADDSNVVPAGTLLQAVTGPYSCVVVNHRSILEVLALAFSNATLVYAVVLTLCFKVGSGATPPDRDTKMV